MTMKRAAIATVVTQLLGLAVASAQPTRPPQDEDDPATGELGGSEPPAEGTPDQGTPTDAATEEVVAEEIGEPVIERGAEVGYDKGFFIKSADGLYTLKLTGRVQPFYAGTFVKGGDDKHAFEVRRGRLTFEGNIHTRSLLYKLQTDFGKGFVTLKDFHVDAKLADNVWLRAGQWKRPFSRQQINSSGRLEITDRSITDKAFGAGRDIGVAIRNDYEKSPDIEWIVGVFNGSGDGASFVPTVDSTGAITGGAFTNVPKKFKPAFIGRVGLNDGGIKGYSEADLEGGPLRWGAAASVWIEGDRDADDSSNQKVELDYVVKASGFSTTGGFYGMSSQTGIKTFSDQELSHVGLHLQAGYMVTPTVQASARYALVDAKLDATKDQQEISVGSNYYAFGHDAKLTGAVRLIKDGAAKFSDDLLFELGANVGF